ncbi:hypothetical protein [Frondihabitans cladoniiphilus]|uniref:Nucleotide exchange factor GrpE n=1 Tax=Frondihabitans cladoniiphilus TaxID=715785 RepID=A0ABP8VIW6_9MICO
MSDARDNDRKDDDEAAVTHPAEVDPETGTDAEDKPVENPSG